MTYEEICIYVFLNEKVGWELRDSKKRDRELVTARQICVYLGNSFFPKMSWSALARPFSKDHATAMHAAAVVKDLMFGDIAFRQKIFTYSNYISEQEKERIEKELKAILKLKDEETLRKLLSVVDKMELVAKIYCEITNQKIIKTE